MFPSSIKRIFAVLVLLVAVAGTALQAAPAAHAHAPSPSVTAIIDAKVYGVMVVAGQNFTPRTTATIQVRDSSGGLLSSVSASIDALGAFVKTVSFKAPTGAQFIDRVTIKVVDASQAVTEELAIPLSSELDLARQQLAAVQQQLADAVKIGAKEEVLTRLQLAVMRVEKELLKLEAAAAVS